MPPEVSVSAQNFNFTSYFIGKKIFRAISTDTNKLETKTYFVKYDTLPFKSFEWKTPNFLMEGLI